MRRIPGIVTAALAAALAWPGAPAVAAAATPATAASPRVVVLVSADTEWRAVRTLYPAARVAATPYGESFTAPAGGEPVLFLHGGWGKIDAAASAQYAIDRWRPRVLVNLGTCGGIAGRVERFATVLVTKAIVYDIVERMGDAQEAIDAYATTLDLDWMKGAAPGNPLRVTILSGDRDGDPAEVAALGTRYGAVAVDWESGSIARVARKNGVRVVILRGVSDVVTPQGSEAYGALDAYAQATLRVMKTLCDALPAWIAAWRTAGALR